MRINGEEFHREENVSRDIAFICDVGFGALRGIVDEFTDDDETANILIEEILRNAWERLSDCE